MNDQPNQPEQTSESASTPPTAPTPVSPPQPQIPDEAKWYVVHTYSGHENKVATALKQRVETMGLKDKIFDVVVPTRNVVVVRHGKKEEILEKMRPFQYGGDMIKEVSYENTTFNDLPWKFEAGTPNVSSGIGLGIAVDYLNKIEMENIRDH